jgi:hypothetical protein
MQSLRVTFGAKIVSISILAKGDAGGLFHNIVFIALFICLRMWFYIFSILTKLAKNKAGEQQGERWLPMGPLAPMPLKN